MLLSRITADPGRFQFRETPFSEQTVATIVAEGIDLAKFDPIPVTASGGRWVVGGDGHSRLEAIRRLADQDRLPKQWRNRNGWNIPTREVTASEAAALAWTANLSRDNFKPAEEARVFQAMLDSGLALEQVAKLAHRCTAHVTRMLALNTLCRDIRAAVGVPASAGGIDVLTGQVLATGFARYGVEVASQQQLWHCVLKHAMLNFQSAKKFIDRIGARLGEKVSDGFLFQVPANAVAVVAEAKARGVAARTAKTGLGLLLSALKAGGLEDFPDLATWLTQHGDRVVGELAERVTEDADVLADLVAPPKPWAPRPATAADARIAKQYDAEATPMLLTA